VGGDQGSGGDFGDGGAVADVLGEGGVRGGVTMFAQGKGASHQHGDAKDLKGEVSTWSTEMSVEYLIEHVALKLWD
jgi:hypothetical protein